MPDTTYLATSTVVTTPSIQDWNNVIYRLLGSSSGAGGTGGAPATRAALRTNMDLPTASGLAASSGASLVGFLQSGTGAVARTAQDKLRDATTPADFGITIDGQSLIVGRDVFAAANVGIQNTGFGYRVLKSVTGGNENTAFGYLALSSVTGGVDPAANYNTAFGSYALALCTTGYKNAAGGRACMDNLTTGNQNAAWGYGSMHFTTTAQNCSALGFEALHENLTNQGISAFGFRALYSSKGDFNSAFGTSALTNATTGARNSAFGTNALNAVTTTSDNAAIGYGAGITHTGSGSIFVGQGADASAGLNNVTVIGGVTATASNTMVLGNSQTVVPGVANFDIGSQSLPTWGYGIFNKAVYAWQGTAIPAGGTTGSGFLLSSTGNFGIFFGSGAPSLTAQKGSLYLRSDGVSNVTRAYINTDSGTTWTAINTVA